MKVEPQEKICKHKEFEAKTKNDFPLVKESEKKEEAFKTDKRIKDDSFENIIMQEILTTTSEEEKIEEFEKLDFLDEAVQALQELGENILDITNTTNKLTTITPKLQKKEILSADDLTEYVVEEKDLIDSETESASESLKLKKALIESKDEEGYEFVSKFEENIVKEKFVEKIPFKKESKDLLESISIKNKEEIQKINNEKLKKDNSEDISLNLISLPDVETCQLISNNLTRNEASIELHFQSNEIKEFEFKLEIFLINIYILEANIVNDAIQNQKLINIENELDKEFSSLEDLNTIQNVIQLNLNYQWIIKRVVRSSVHQHYNYCLARVCIFLFAFLK